MCHVKWDGMSAILLMFIRNSPNRLISFATVISQIITTLDLYQFPTICYKHICVGIVNLDFDFAILVCLCQPECKYLIKYESLGINNQHGR